MASTARSPSALLISTEILISLVEIIWMFTLRENSASNISAATPGWVSMPAPTMDTLVTLSSETMLEAPHFSVFCWSRAMASSILFLSTVKLISCVPFLPIDWRIISTLILACAIAIIRKEIS